ncbi:MAG: DUF192 domain-containing protein [Rhizobiaceae bacterium]
MVFAQRKIFALLAVVLALTFSVMLSVVLANPTPDPNAVFPVETLSLKTSAGEFSFSVEIADEDAERQHGLMFREAMLPTHGMLFEFSEPQHIYMWMENTPLPLDMIFIRPDGTVSSIAANTVPMSRRIIASREMVSHVLELNAGMALQIGLKSGDKVSHRFFGKSN